MKKFFHEFKEFAMRGNVLDMAIGVVIGAAFGKITTSLVNDIIMPLIGLITGGIDLTQWNIVLNRAAVAAGDAAPVMLGIGNLLAVILDFIIVAFAMFLLVKAMNKLAALKKKDEEPAPEEPAGPTTEELLAEIRDLLNTYCGYNLGPEDVILFEIDGAAYFLADIGLRMLTPRELYRANGFPDDYKIERDYTGTVYPKTKQVARCGNAVPPPFATALVRANLPEWCSQEISTMEELERAVAV